MITIGMMATSHMLTAGVLVWKIVDTSWKVVLIAIIASLFADIDEPESFIGRRLFLIAIPLNLIFGHRTITHSLLGATITTLVCYILTGQNITYTVAWAVGYTSHILLDTITNSGTTLFWPYPKKIGINIISTGGIFEFAYIAIFLFFSINHIF